MPTNASPSWSGRVSAISTWATPTKPGPRALAALGRDAEAKVELDAARSVEVADADDRQIFESDLSSPPWFGLT